MSLIDSLIEEGWLKTPRIIEAFRKIKRIDFLPEPIQKLIDQNRVNTSQSDYLLLHTAFNMEFSKYIP